MFKIHPTPPLFVCCRSDREKIALQSKMKTLQRKIHKSLAPQENIRASDDTGGPRVLELENIVMTMKKVIEKLQGDNEKLKRRKSTLARTTGSKTTEAGSCLHEENTKLKVYGSFICTFYCIL